MPKLIDDAPNRTVPIGRDGLEAFCNELNANRAARGWTQFYYLKVMDGLLTLQDEAQGVR